MTSERDAETETERVIVVGAGVAGLTAGIFTARAGLDTVVVDGGAPILERNAFLENVPGFPAGVDARLFLEMTREQARRAGCLFTGGPVTAVRETPDAERRFAVRIGSEESADADGDADSTSDGDADASEPLRTDYVVCTSWSDTDYLDGLDVGLVDRGSKTYVDVDDRGFTGVDGLYAAGRVAETHHQTIVAAGNGAEVALNLIDDSEIPFYHDWVAPEGYFTGRGREVPPGCEEIDDAERLRREAESREVMTEYFAEPHPDEPTMHPSVSEE